MAMLNNQMIIHLGNMCWNDLYFRLRSVPFCRHPVVTGRTGGPSRWRKACESVSTARSQVAVAKPSMIYLFVGQWGWGWFTGWWFGTWLLFSIIYGIILLIGFHIFQDGSNQHPVDVNAYECDIQLQLGKRLGMDSTTEKWVNRQDADGKPMIWTTSQEKTVEYSYNQPKENWYSQHKIGVDIGDINHQQFN